MQSTLKRFTSLSVGEVFYVEGRPFFKVGATTYRSLFDDPYVGGPATDITAAPRMVVTVNDYRPHGVHNKKRGAK